MYNMNNMLQHEHEHEHCLGLTSLGIALGSGKQSVQERSKAKMNMI